MELKKEITVGALLGRTSHNMSLLLDKVFHKNDVDLNVEQFVLLKILSFNDGLNQKKLSELIDRDKTTIARLITKMEKKNMLLRVNSREDKRVNNVYITNYGKEILHEVLPFIREVDDVLISSVTREELQVFTRVMYKLCDKIKLMEEKL
ncbi:MAG: MarR family transcriptional regulator [Bacteroidota bacterium]